MPTYFVEVDMSTNEDVKHGRLVIRTSRVQVQADTDWEAEIVAAQIACCSAEITPTTPGDVTDGLALTEGNSAMPTAARIDWEATIAKEVDEWLNARSTDTASKPDGLTTTCSATSALT